MAGFFSSTEIDSMASRMAATGSVLFKDIIPKQHESGPAPASLPMSTHAQARGDDGGLLDGVYAMDPAAAAAAVQDGQAGLQGSSANYDYYASQVSAAAPRGRSSVSFAAGAGGAGAGAGGGLVVQAGRSGFGSSQPRSVSTSSSSFSQARPAPLAVAFTSPVAKAAPLALSPSPTANATLVLCVYVVDECRTVYVRVPSSATVADVKVRIEKTEGISRGRQHLWMAGTTKLGDDAAGGATALRDFGVNHREKLTLTLDALVVTPRRRHLVQSGLGAGDWGRRTTHGAAAAGTGSGGGVAPPAVAPSASAVAVAKVEPAVLNPEQLLARQAVCSAVCRMREQEVSGGTATVCCCLLPLKLLCYIAVASKAATPEDIRRLWLSKLLGGSGDNACGLAIGPLCYQKGNPCITKGATADMQERFVLSDHEDVRDLIAEKGFVVAFAREQ